MVETALLCQSCRNTPNILFLPKGQEALSKGPLYLCLRAFLKFSSSPSDNFSINDVTWQWPRDAHRPKKPES